MVYQGEYIALVQYDSKPLCADSNSQFMYEVGWGGGNGGSSGGFSGDFPIPSWQASQVSAYLRQPGLPTTFFNGTGRGLPDLSAPGKSETRVL